MRRLILLLKRLGAAAIFAVVAASYAQAQCAGSNPPGPCELEVDLHWAMARGPADPPPYPNWERSLDWSFNHWRNGSSQNSPVLGHAIALWRPVAGQPLANKVNWWHTFFNCQNGGGAPCSIPGVADVGSLKYMKGTELLSHNYDAHVTAAVASVHLWARKNNNPPLADKARKYLRVTFAMYGLAAGAGPARVLIDDDPNPNPAKDNCQRNTSGTSFYYTGPFVAAAGMRANVAYVCTDDRGVLLSRALHLSFRNNRESAAQALVVNYLQAEWARMGIVDPQENVYALDPGARTLVNEHIRNGNKVEALKSVLAGVRTSVVYHFIGWATTEGQVRATVMEQNRNGNTAPVMAEKYTHGAGGEILAAHILVPDTDFRNNVPQATAKLLPDAAAPTMVEARSFYPDGSLNRIVSMPVPAYGKLYHLVLSPTQEPYLIP